MGRKLVHFFWQKVQQDREARPKVQLFIEEVYSSHLSAGRPRCKLLEMAENCCPTDFEQYTARCVKQTAPRDREGYEYHTEEGSKG